MIPSYAQVIIRNIKIGVFVLLIIGLAVEFGIIMAGRVKVEKLNTRILELEQEKNLIAQDMAKVKKEQEEKEIILAEYRTYIEKLEAARTVAEYIKIWKELDTR